MQLYIEGKEVDMAPGTVLAVTVQSNDISKPDTVQSSYTNTVTLPKTQRNNAILSHAGHLQSLSDTPYRQLEADVLHDGVELLPLPKARLERTAAGFEVQIFAGAVDFFSLLADKSIRDLDLSQFDHVRNLDAVADGAGWHRTFVDGYIYDLQDRGVPVSRGNLYPEHLYPSVFVRAVYAQMMVEAGVNWQLEDAVFDRMLLPFSNGKPVHGAEWVAARQYSFPLNNLPTLPVHYGHVEVTIKINVTALPGGVLNANTGAYVAVALRSATGMTFGSYRMDITALGEQESKATFHVSPLFDLAGLYLNVTRENLTTGTPPPGVIISHGAYYSTDSTIKFSYQEESVYRSTWEIAPNLPDIKQKDFFKMVNALFNLMPNYDPYSNTMELIPMQELEANKTTALDWSDKLVNIDEAELQYRFGNFAQKSWFRYAEDETGGDGNGFLVVDDHQLPQEEDVLTLPVAASATVAGYVVVPVLEAEVKALGSYDTIVDTVADLANVSIPIFPAKKRVLVTDAATDNPYTGYEKNYIYSGSAIYTHLLGRWILTEQEITYKRTGVKPRLTLHNPDSRLGVLLREKNQGAGRSLNMTASTFAGLDWPAILAERYAVLAGILDKAKGLTVDMLLTPVEVQNYRAEVPVWLEQYGSYFYLNQIEFYENSPAIVELWRL